MEDRLIRILLVSILYFILSLNHQGECRVIHNVNSPESIKINDISCNLNGVAFTEIQGFDVYIGALDIESSPVLGKNRFNLSKSSMLNCIFFIKKLKRFDYRKL